MAKGDVRALMSRFSVYSFSNLIRASIDEIIRRASATSASTSNSGGHHQQVRNSFFSDH
jgi:hypothetical protein